MLLLMKYFGYLNLSIRVVITSPEFSPLKALIIAFPKERLLILWLAQSAPILLASTPQTFSVYVLKKIAVYVTSQPALARTSSITVEILLSYRPSGIIRLRTIPTFGSVLPAMVRCSPIVSSTSPSTVSPKIHLLRASWLGGISPGWLAMAS